MCGWLGAGLGERLCTVVFRGFAESPPSSRCCFAHPVGSTYTSCFLGGGRSSAGMMYLQARDNKKNVLSAGVFCRRASSHTGEEAEGRRGNWRLVFGDGGGGGGGSWRGAAIRFTVTYPLGGSGHVSKVSTFMLLVESPQQRSRLNVRA